MPRLYWTDADKGLVARTPSRYCVRSPARLVEEILEQLAAGPLEKDRAAGLGSALPPQRWVTLERLDGDLATLRVAPDATPGANRATLAAAQVVLSVTSIPGVERVALVHDDDILQVPLPDGELATGPLTAQTYASTLADPHQHVTTPPATLADNVICPGSPH